MLIEQALFYLPEILFGQNYQLQTYEGGIVAAFSMAILQELNSRNINNPLSHLICEKRYNPKGFKSSINTQRYLRADLYLDTSKLGVSNDMLSSYGFRKHNWVEAKFFRRGLSDRTQNMIGLASDLLRLCCLTPHIKPKSLYLLHVYDDDPGNYVSRARNFKGQRLERPWLRGVLTPGSNKSVIMDLSVESQDFKSRMNSYLCDCLTLRFDTSNLGILPRSDQYRSQLFLTRIDKFVATLVTPQGTVHMGQSPDASLIGSDEEYQTISSFVGALLGTTEDTKLKPSEQALVQGETTQDDT